MNWMGATFSPIFSAQRCRYPRCGVTSEMTSPSVRSTSRNTPCVLGCCGPMLTSISSVRTSNSMMVGSATVAMRKSLQSAIQRAGGVLYTELLLCAFHDPENRFDFIRQRLLPQPSDFQPKSFDDATSKTSFDTAHLSELARIVESQERYFLLERVNNPVLFHASRLVLVSFCHVVPLNTVGGHDFDCGIGRPKYIGSPDVCFSFLPHE